VFSPTTTGEAFLWGTHAKALADDRRCPSNELSGKESKREKHVFAHRGTWDRPPKNVFSPTAERVFAHRKTCFRPPLPTKNLVTTTVSNSRDDP